jgi:hypothetical protein
MKFAVAGLVAMVLGACATAPEPAQETWTYPPEILRFKAMFAQMEQVALSQPFTGIRTKDGVQPNLFSVRATGVSTEPVRAAAEAFLARLTKEQALKVMHDVTDLEWRRWYNVDNGIYSRRGVSLADMNAMQRAAAMRLLQASLSAKGFELTEDIRKTDQTLREINDQSLMYGEDLYFFTMMGTPSATEPWGWQIDGHHLVINYFVLGDQVVMTPAFWGAEPAVARTGKYAGNSVLQEEQDMGLALMQSLDATQRSLATLDSRKTVDNLKAGAGQDNLVLEYAGVPVNTFTTEQKARLLELIGLFVGNVRDDQAKIKMEEVMALLDHAWFAWVGPVDDDAVFYYRIHSPVVLIEFDHQRPVGTSSINTPGTPTRDHIHVIVRTPNGNDYGKDLLAEHLASHPH